MNATNSMPEFTPLPKQLRLSGSLDSVDARDRDRAPTRLPRVPRPAGPGRGRPARVG